MSRERFPHYQRLIRLYPKQYREQYGSQMTQTLADMLDHATTQAERRAIWAKVSLDFPVSLIKSQVQDAGDIIMHDTPKYLSGSGLLAGLLVVPFFAALIANGLDKVFNDRTLYNSWLWHHPALGLWVLWLPSLALVIALASYLTYTLRKNKQSKVSVIHRAFDVKRIWPVIVPGVLALAILFILAFHDSAHCWVQNPVHFVTRFHQTLTCTRTGYLGG